MEKVGGWQIVLLLVERFQNFREGCLLIADDIDWCVGFCSDWVLGWLRGGSSVWTD